jgi:tRNA A-37 threonylcarbamoyl transferase component Bud32
MVPAGCPYTVGAELALLLTDLGRHTSACHVHVRVLETYPFTMSQTMKVSLLNQSGEYGVPLPPIAILKLYDHRYLGGRLAAGEEPWDPQKAALAETINQRIHLPLLDIESVIRSAGTSSPCNKGDVIVSEVIDFDEDDYDEELKSLKADPDAIHQWIIETDYRYRTTSWFKTECRAYRQLHSLHGISVPKFYGVTTFDKISQSPPLGIDFNIPGILLEFIDGVTLEDIDSHSSLAITNPHIGQIAIDCFEQITSLGILHGDVRLANIILNTSGRIYIIDFALSRFRGDVSDGEWEHRVVQLQELSSLKKFLDEKELRDQTPPEPYSDYVGNYSRYNRFVEAAREAWRVKYYEPVIGGEFDSLRREDEHGRLHVVWLPQWLPNHRALAERKINLNRLRLCYRQGT